MRTAAATLALAAASSLFASAPAAGQEPAPAHGVPGVRAEHLRADFWVERLPHPGRVLLEPGAIAERNARMLAVDPSMHDLAGLPPVVTGEEVRRRIEARSVPPTRTLWDEAGDTVPASRIAEFVDALALDAIPGEREVSFGLVTRRSDLRTFPTALRVFSAPGGTDIDRWQETAAFPGTAVAVLHESRDGAWWFVVSRHYAAWVEKSGVAIGPRDVVLGYGGASPYLVVTGAREHTVFTPERPEVSRVPLEMGVRVPLLADWPPSQPVNGQHPYAGHVVQLPVRGPDGALELVPALLPLTADVSEGYLPFTPEGIVRQAFKFLGERYGWGHSYDGRDCSGFVSEVYRSFGVDLPRNTGDQAASTVLDRLVFGEGEGREARLAALGGARAGDLVYVPGHVVMVLGRVGGVTYVIHDVVTVEVPAADGGAERVHLNGVSVTPFEPLGTSLEQTWVDRIRVLQRMGG